MTACPRDPIASTLMFAATISFRCYESGIVFDLTRLTIACIQESWRSIWGGMCGDFLLRILGKIMGLPQLLLETGPQLPCCSKGNAECLYSWI